ncbi:Exodeoxyribonuclease I subunit D [Peptoclostridium litorale DSM 5388]|uniref:Nuclease SbcCD subunit D n=1 Tax=Peptoclostridium litorale DSM 5388 TaxID=1121324 RepID=A0A069RIB1_PEPLI|nr:exonuclease SbcCD subunit D [Peptoclostridium litorale]KDR96764.1 nuclease SbcCD subunit D [Peptoclostridium litorale DSM 5388]SIO34674.1 Exodeoxyribonuclease I subunit D [Peptoclostridium litorale DSM 5388]
MKIIHTGDWHIGKIVHNIHMTDDQRYIMERFMDILEREKPDVVIIAGDIYDRSIPPVEAVELLDEVLSGMLKKLGVKVIAAAGNHDSPDRINFASSILVDKGLYMRGRFENITNPVSLEDEHGRVNFYVVPYAEPAVVRSYFDREDIKSHDDAMKAVTQAIYESMDKNERNVFVGHGFVTYTSGDGKEEEALTSDSERPLSIGGSEHVDVSYFEGFDYVALGHLHRAQRVKFENIRYSGSIMKYSFSEHMHKKSVTCIEMEEKGETSVSFADMEPLRDMRVIKGRLEDLIKSEIYSLGNVDDYIMAVLTDRQEVYDAIGKLRAVYPNILKIEMEGIEREAGEDRSSAADEFVKRDPIELFCEFYENISGKPFDHEKRDELVEITQAMDIEGRRL